MKELTVSEAQAARSEGIAQVAAGADPNWASDAYDFIAEYAKTHPDVFCDDLWEAGLEMPREPRALGPVMLKASRDGLISPSGNYRPSVHSKMGVKSVWKSNVYPTS